MDIIKRCKVYPLDRFLRPRVQNLVWLQQIREIKQVNKVGVVHIIEKSIGLVDNWKCNLLEQLLNHEEFGSVLVVDVISVWRDAVCTANNHENIHYNNSPKILQFAGLIEFLAQLNDNPELALCKHCSQHGPLDLPLKAILIDNISVYQYQHSLDLQLLRKWFDTLRSSLGCAVITFGYGIEYYEGVENSFPARSSDFKNAWPTRLDPSYLLSVDAVLVPTQTKSGVMPLIKKEKSSCADE